jgi:ABC-2 type transport system ATP-binding protein
MAILSMKNVEERKGNAITIPKISLHIDKGEIVAIQCNSEVGKNLLGMLSGEIAVLNGEITLLDEKYPCPFHKVANQIGIFSLNEGMYERLTVKEYLQLFKRLYDVAIDVEEYIHKAGLTELRQSKIGKLSYSEKKRLQLAKTILHNPQFILMEEPDQNLDIESKFIIQQVIKELAAQGTSFLITTSNFESAVLLTNHVYKLNEDGMKKIKVVEEIGEMGTASDSEVKEEEKIVEEIHPINFEKIPAKVDDKIILFDPTEISYVESNEGTTYLHVKEEAFPCTYTLNELFNRLQPFGFFRCHRSYIVNLQKVREVITWTRNSYSLVLEDTKKSSIPLSKGNLAELKQILRI